MQDYTLTRSLIKIDTVKDQNGKREFPLMENKVGYVRLAQFGEQTSSDLEDALAKLEKQGVEALVLDLRDNPGGLLDQAVQVCEKFLPKGQLIVSTEGRDAQQKAMYHGKGRGKASGHPHRRPRQRRQRQRGGNRRRLPAGLHRAGRDQGDHPRRADLRQRFGAKHSPAAGQLGVATHHGEILHAQPQGHS